MFPLLWSEHRQVDPGGVPVRVLAALGPGHDEAPRHGSMDNDEGQVLPTPLWPSSAIAGSSGINSSSSVSTTRRRYSVISIVPCGCCPRGQASVCSLKHV